KLLDFGLARAAAITPWNTRPPTNASSYPHADPTVHRALTAEGTIVGTFHYMAPEQLEGAAVDARTDIFALGAVLYEMATGRLAFDGATKTSVIAAIVDRDPPPMQQIQPLTPPALEHVISRCLAKESAERWQSAHDVARELTWIREAGSNAAISSVVSIRRKHREGMAWTIAAIAVAGAILTGLFGWRRLQNTTPPQVMRFTVPSISGLRLNAVYGLIAISPDGSQMVNVASDKTGPRLFRRSVDNIEQVAIEGTDGAYQPFFSPDGKWIGFVSRHKLMKVAISGGQPIALASASEARGAEWADDDTIFFCPFYYGGIERVSAAGGPSKPVTTVDRAHGERSHRWPHLLPGGKVLLYSVGRGGSWDDATVVAQRLDTGERKTLIEGGSDARYLPTGHLVYLRGTSLYAVPFDTKTLAVSGQPVEVACGVANNGAGAGEFAFTPAGMLAYYSVGIVAEEGGMLSVINARGDKLPAVLPPFIMYSPRFSPDGTKIAGMRGNAVSVWTCDLVRGTSTRLTTGARTKSPVWSRDGSRVYYSSEHTGPWNPFWQDADGGGAEHSVVKTEESIIVNGISPDGRELLVTSNRKETGADIDIMTIADGRLRPLAKTEAAEEGATYSPDGKWVAYESDESGRSEIYVRSASGASGRWQISVDGGTNPRWKKQAEIVFQNGTKLMTAAVRTAPSFSVATPQVLMDRAPSDYDITSDGRIIIVEPPPTESGRGQINVVLNWFEEIRAKTGGRK
ncbi:MAG: protein kinase, partial [Thermoanaerobaculia bacterium]